MNKFLKLLLKKHGLNKFIQTYQNNLAILNKSINLNLINLKDIIMKVVNIIKQPCFGMLIVKIEIKAQSIGLLIKIQKLLNYLMKSWDKIMILLKVMSKTNTF